MPRSHVLLFFPTLAELPGREVEIPLLPHSKGFDSLADDCKND